jgi:hypothetical protein
LEFPTSFNVTVTIWHRMDFLGHGTIHGSFSHCGNQQFILSKIWFASIIRVPLGAYGCPWPYVHWLVKWRKRAYSRGWQPSNVTNVRGWHCLVFGWQQKQLGQNKTNLKPFLLLFLRPN